MIVPVTGVSRGSVAPKMVDLRAFHAHVHANGEGGSREREREHGGAERDEGAMKHVSSFHEGNGSANGRSSDSGLPPSPPSRPRPVTSWRRSVSPHSGGTVPDLHRLPLTARPYVGETLTPGRVDGPGRDTSRPYAGEVALDRFLVWAPVVVWAGCDLPLSSIPHLGTGLGTWDLVGRKIAHVAEFALLGALLFRALRSAPVAVALGSLYAITDEVHQSFVDGRVGSPLDWAIDTVGVVAGVAVLARRR